MLTVQTWLFREQKGGMAEFVARAQDMILDLDDPSMVIVNDEILDNFLFFQTYQVKSTKWQPPNINHWSSAQRGGKRGHRQDHHVQLHWVRHRRAGLQQPPLSQDDEGQDEACGRHLQADRAPSEGEHPSLQWNQQVSDGTLNESESGFDIGVYRATYQWALSIASPVALERLETKVFFKFLCLTSQYCVNTNKPILGLKGYSMVWYWMFHTFNFVWGFDTESKHLTEFSA